MISLSRFSKTAQAAGKTLSLSLFVSLVLGGSPAAYAQALPTPGLLAQRSSPEAASETASETASEPTSEQTAPSGSRVRQGLPGRRSAAASRNWSSLGMIVLAPTETPWLSLSEEPSLLVYIEGDRQQSQLLEVLVGSNQDEDQQIYDQFFEVPAEGGIFKITLTDPLPGQQLRPGKSYLWQVSLISDPENRSSDRYAAGELVQPQPDSLFPPAASKEVSHRDPLVRAQALASLGLWQAAALTLYDALQSPNLSAAERTQAQADWAALLETIELGELAKAPLQAELTATQISQQL